MYDMMYPIQTNVVYGHRRFKCRLMIANQTTTTVIQIENYKCYAL